jgi:hypothetical protein
MSKSESLNVAQAILAQLGGQRFLVMTGARNLVGDAQRERGSLSFKVGKNAKGVTHVRITLQADDLYRVESLKLRGVSVAALATADGVYADQLRATFTAQTGLDTSL